MAAEIVAAGIPTVGAVAPMVVEVVVDLAAEIAADSEAAAFRSQVFQLDVTSVEIHVPFHLNQTEASRFCAETVSEETKAVAIHEALIEPRRLDDSMTVTTDLNVAPQDQLLWVQA